MSINTISGLSIKDRDYNSYFQQAKDITDSNYLGSPAIGKIVGGIYLSGTQVYTNFQGVPLSFTSDGSLRTSASIGSISIGNVYVQSGANVILSNASTDVGMTGLIVGNIETTVVIHTIIGNYYLTGFDGTSTADATFKLYHNGSIQTTLRTNPAQRNIEKNYAYPLLFITGSVILTVEHTNANSQNFDATLYGIEK